MWHELMCRSEPLSCPSWLTEMIGYRKCVVKCMGDVRFAISPAVTGFIPRISKLLADWLRSTGKYHLAAKWMIPIVQDAVINGVKWRRRFSCDRVACFGCSVAKLSQTGLKPCFYWLPCWLGTGYDVEEISYKLSYGQAQVYKLWPCFSNSEQKWRVYHYVISWLKIWPRTTNKNNEIIMEHVSFANVDRSGTWPIGVDVDGTYILSACWAIKTQILKIKSG